MNNLPGKRLNVYADRMLVRRLEKVFQREATKYLRAAKKNLSYSSFLAELLDEGLRGYE